MLPLKENEILTAFKEICEVRVKDDVMFKIQTLSPIRHDAVYGGYRIRLDAVYGTITTALSIDITTGDIITPDPVLYAFTGIFNEEKKLKYGPIILKQFWQKKQKQSYDEVFIIQGQEIFMISIF